MVNETFLTLDIRELMLLLELSNEQVLDVQYFFALEKPKPKQSTPCDEWISQVQPLRHILNEKAKSYCVSFFNGDLGLYNSKHAQLLKVSQLHADSAITDVLYFKSDANGDKFVVTCSEMPDPQLVISRLATDKGSLEVIARAKDEVMEETNCGYTCMA